MARSKEQRNGRLEEAMSNLLQSQAILVQNQAAFQANQAAFQADMREINKEIADLRRQTDARFARIEAMLIEHTRILQALPEAVREKIGFKAPA